MTAQAKKSGWILLSQPLFDPRQKTRCLMVQFAPELEAKAQLYLNDATPERATIGA